MSFISSVEQGLVYAPGYFLAHEECERKTKQIAQSGATNVNGRKYVPMGTLYTETHEEEVEGVDTTVTDYVGFIYEDVDVTTGDMPGSVVLKGVVYEDRLPAELTSEAKTALEARGFTFVTEPAVTRPDWTNS
jgi:hypothetical protein